MRFDNFQSYIFFQISKADTNITITVERIYNDVIPASYNTMSTCERAPEGVESCTCSTCTAACTANAQDGYYHNEGVCTMYR